MISEDGDRITGIIDWESAAYYPRFWLATKPEIASVFWLECPTDEPELWGRLLSKRLQRHGFDCLATVFREWNNGRIMK